MCIRDRDVTTQNKERTQKLSATHSSSTPKQLPPPEPASLFKATVKSVAKDGNCLFSAVQLGDKSTVREVAVDWIESHLEDNLLGGQTYRSYIEEEKKVKAEVYISNMRKTRVWGGLPELYALATLAGLRLR
eukprot:4201914-Prymnesium_polylepis.1